MSNFRRHKMKCVYGLCNSDSRYFYKDYMQNVKFYKFPQPSKDLIKCKTWLKCCGRDENDFNETNVRKWSYVCSKHFFGGMGPTLEHPDPIPLSEVPQDQQKSWHNVKRKLKIFQQEPENASPSADIPLPASLTSSSASPSGSPQASPKSPLPIPSELIEDRSFSIPPDHFNLTDLTEQFYKSRSTETVYFQVDVLTQTESTNCQDTSTETEKTDKNNNKACQTSVMCATDNYTQTMHPRYAKNLFGAIKATRSANSSQFQLSYQTLLENSKDFKYFTGLDPKHFHVLYTFLDPPIMQNLKYTYRQRTPKKHNLLHVLKDTDKLLLTLIRLRRGYTLKELSVFYNISVPCTEFIVFTWIQFMFCQLSRLKPFLFSKKTEQKTRIPSCFRPFKNLRTIIDCTEIKIQTPKNFQQQGNTYSSYKSSNTVKFLVGISVHGAIMYVSEGYEGSISDRELFIDCDIRSFLDENDIVMADRGFNIQDILNEMKVELIIPPFLMGRDKLTREEERLTKLIAKARIHVERCIRRIKCYKLLSGPVQNSLLPLLTQMFFICACLVNFEADLVI